MSTPNKVVSFFDPHPGLAGCLAPIPDVVKDIADSLNGCVMNLTDAMAQFQREFPGGTFAVHDDMGFIGLTVGDYKKGETQHSWRVIRFRDQ